jgi:monoterpene epsilon-lactone hydrolase
MNESPESHVPMNADLHREARARSAPGRHDVRKRRAETNSKKAAHRTLPAPLRAIGNEHKYIARLLVILGDEMEALRSSGRCDYEAVNRVMDYMARFPDRYHHPKEDLIFDRMRGPATAGVIAELRRSHQDIAAENLRLRAEIRAQEFAPSRTRALELGRSIRSYCVRQRDHMRLEERRVFAPALAQLSESDWAEIDRQIAPVADPIFGAEKAARYLGLFRRHVDRVVTVTCGAVPTGMLEIAAMGAERVVSTAWHLGRLPTQLLATGRASLLAQMHSLAGLARARDIGALTRSTEAYLKTCGEGGRRAAAQIHDAIHANNPRAEGGTGDPVMLVAEDDFLSFEQRPYTPTYAAMVSWQASVSNLMFRMFVKPLMSHIGPDSAAHFKRWMQGNDEAPPGMKSTAVEGASFRARWLEPLDSPGTKRTILYLPGGAFFFPATNGHTRLLAQLVQCTGCRGMLVHYRLAPEHPFPAGLDDALAAYRYLLDSGIAADEIVIAGDSAGGGLALSLLLAIRDEGLPLPAAGAFISALTDLSFSTPSRKSNKWRDPMLPTNRELKVFGLYTGNTPLNDPLLSPIYGSFHGLPPMFAQVGSTEVLLDDTLRIARKARLQGVDFELEIWEGLAHDWHLFSWIPESRQALSRVAAFFQTRLDLLAERSAINATTPPATALAPRRRRRNAAAEVKLT